MTNETPQSSAKSTKFDVDLGSRAPVSVVIPYFNSGEEIYRAVRSVWSQSWPPAQVIIVDDASDDPDTSEIFADLGALFSDRLRIVRCPENLGPANARNHGWGLASEAFVAFLDADDVWHHQKLELQLPLMLSDPQLKISGHPFTVFPEIDSPGERGPQPAAHSVTFRGALFLNPFATSSVIVRQDITERFNASRRFSEDYDLWLRILHAHGHGRKLRTPLYTRFKPPVGDSGLSSRILKMEAGQTRAYKDLREKRNLSWSLYVAVRAWAAVRFVRRLLLVGTRLGARRLHRVSPDP